MAYKSIVNTILGIYNNEIIHHPDENPGVYRWYLGFDVVNQLWQHNHVIVNVVHQEPRLIGIRILVDYENPSIIKLYKECRG